MKYTIKEIASQTNVTVRTLHYYDEINLLKPCCTNDGNRIYSDNEIVLMNCIQFYKQLGFSLNDIKSLLENKTGKESLENILKKQIAILEEENANHRLKLNQINEIIKTKKTSDSISSLIESLDYQVTKNNTTPLHFVQKILTIPFYKRLTYAFIFLNAFMWFGVIALILEVF